jgi:cytochrome c peroxidase
MGNGCRPSLALGIGIALLSSTTQTSLATPADLELLDRAGPQATSPGRSKKALIELGRDLFFNETFEGNGRTCGTCHPASNNLTIDKAFIDTLPDDDPLFVQEFDPDLAELEDALLLREFGLILENLDGFDAPPVFRGVPHNFGARMTMTPPPGGLDGRKSAAGWSGDGAPRSDHRKDDGSLRNFINAAITQHYPKTLARIEGKDFRLATEEEKDAIEAFLLSMGRQEEIDLAAMTFSDPAVELGKKLFNNDDGDGNPMTNRACAACHMNAGANDADGFNRNFDIGTQTLTPPERQHDDGFGDETFNVPTLIEAADTPPFNHNNSFDDLEEAIAFYTGPAFGASQAGRFDGLGAFDLEAHEVDTIGALLRTLNAMENIRFSNEVTGSAQRSVPPVARKRIEEEVLSNTRDAIEVLTEAKPFPLYPDAVALLEQAEDMEQQALTTDPKTRRNALLGTAVQLKRDASAMMLGEPE